jgi:cystathionine beta-lyase/cystathionine gamma-synthase
MFEIILPRFNVTHTYIDGTDIDNFWKEIKPNTTVIYLESPNSWTFDIQDMKEIAVLAKQQGIVTICDNSFCTPLYQRPYEMGIDLVLQSATKYISGHSDTVAGVLSGSKEMIRKIFESEYLNIGSGIQPFNAWLLIRGLRTLPARLERITRTTTAVIDFLKSHPLVEEVIFPLDPSFKQYKLAKEQMSGACGLLTIVMKAEKVDEIETFCNALEHILMAVSWGGYESLIIPGCAGIKKEAFEGTREQRMLRLYVGLEDADYIINDLQQAFNKVLPLS